jgi:PAS domain S-box-containing protein
VTPHGDDPGAEPLFALNEGRLAWISHQAPVMIWVSRVDQTCVYFNHRWLDFTGRTLTEELAVGEDWAEAVHAEDRRRCLRGYREAFEARQAFMLEYRLRRAEGDYRSIQDRGAPWYSTAGEFEGFIGCCVDTTEQKRAEARVREQEADFARLHYQSALGQFTAVMAHDLSQPLMAMMNYVEGARRAFAEVARGNPLFAEFLDETQRLTRRAAEVVRLLREYGRGQAPRPVAVDVNQVIQNALRLTRREAEQRQARVTLDLATGLPRAMIDPTSLFEVLSSLLLYALEGGGPASPAFRVQSLVNPFGEVEVCVQADLGYGLPSTAADPVTRRSIPAKREAVWGVGLPVSACRAVIEAQGGRLMVRAIPPGGTFVQISLAKEGEGGG